MQSDIILFCEEALSKRPAVNVITSPLLVSTTEQITNAITKEANLQGEIPFLQGHQTRPNIKNQTQGIHVQSKRGYIDKTLERLEILHTNSRELERIGYERATLDLNKLIAKDTKGMITDFLDPENLNDPNLAFRLVTWLFQQVSWEEPFEVMDKDQSSKMTWINQSQPEIEWMGSKYSTNTIGHKSFNGFDFIEVPVKESGIRAVFILPPKDVMQKNDDNTRSVLSIGLDSLICKPDIAEALLQLPKVKFDYQYSKDYPSGGNGIHKAALNIDEEGAAVAAASSMCVADGGSSQPILRFTFDHPFYFAMVNHQNQQDPRIVGMAFINQPWND